MQIISGILLTLIALFLAAPALAEEKNRPPVACDQNENIGSIFYDFDKMIIYYVDFMELSDQPGFPEALTYEKFNNRLLESVKRNFSLCLTDADGKDKPIVVIPPARMRMSYQEHKRYNPERIHDPKALTLLVRGNYLPNYEVAPDAEGLGYVLTFWYRPEVSYKEARLPLGNSMDLLTLPPRDQLGKLEHDLNAFFDNKRPKKMGEMQGGMHATPKEREMLRKRGLFFER